MIPFAERHIGPNEQEIQSMLKHVSSTGLEDLIQGTVPKNILFQGLLDLSSGDSESEVLERAQQMAHKNKVFRSFIGQGYYGTETPTVILRNVLENPSWYTAYTPYQPEISQGRLEALINFQTMVSDLTGMELSNASLLDEATAAAEAMTMAYGLSRKKKTKFFVHSSTFPQTIEVLQTRAEPLGVELVIGDSQDSLTEDLFGAYVQYPNAAGEIHDLEPWSEKIHSFGSYLIVGTDLLALTLYKPPGEMGADIVVGSSQRFGVPMGFGGPHAAFLAAKQKMARSIPGRIVGVSKDRLGNPAYRLTLQTREQHIRREKATSNICTAQVLLAVMAGMYAVYHGPKGLKAIAQEIKNKTNALKTTLSQSGFEVSEEECFDTFTVKATSEQAKEIRAKANKAELNLWYSDNTISISLDETKSWSDVEELAELFTGESVALSESQDALARTNARTSEYMTHPVFSKYQSETEMLRYIQRLQLKDLTLANSMIPLGSCTMKLNSTTEMLPVSWPEFAHLHPFAPLEQVQGTLEMIHQLEGQLCEITGFDAVTLQPNAGSQGEYTGLLTIRAYHQANGQSERNICLIPSSAHGTNPASAVMAGMKVVIVQCDDQGNIDIDDLTEKATTHSSELSALMITYPSTHGVFEEKITDICKVIHDHGGQVYMDGANMNALVGIARPGDFGADVAHLNLHKTFCIPHGGGGPGVGPIGTAKHLSPYLPKHNIHKECGPETGISAVAAAPWGSALILPISWSYIHMMGAEGLKKATEVAILNANYMADRLKDHYPVLYTGKNGRVAHECIIDIRPIKESSGIGVEDIAKRLMDFGYHAPTMSWPVLNTLMIEPTESETQEEMDRFCDAMIQIRKEITSIEKGQSDKENNPLKMAPHTAADLVADHWDHPYSRTEAFYPLPWVKDRKFWVSANRIDNAYGDKNIMCSCIPLSEY